MGAHRQLNDQAALPPLEHSPHSSREMQEALKMFTEKDSIDNFQRLDTLYDMAATVALAKARCR